MKLRVRKTVGIVVLVALLTVCFAPLHQPPSVHAAKFTAPMQADPDADWLVTGADRESFYGNSLNSAGDVNGDGYDDAIVGERNYGFYIGGVNGTPVGKAYVYHGGLFGLSTTPSWTTTGTGHSYYGFKVSKAGDVNGDGYSDVLVSAPHTDNTLVDQGAVYAFYGSPNGLSINPNWVYYGSQVNEKLGMVSGPAGDVNGDGCGDIFVSAPSWDLYSDVDYGRVLIFYGSITGLGQNPNRTYQGYQSRKEFGNSVTGAGDVNGDGYDDLLIGDSLYENQGLPTGRALMYYGSASGLPQGPNWTLVGAHSGAYVGLIVAAAGDVNGDSYSDVAISSKHSPEMHYYVDVFYGSSTGPGITPSWFAGPSQGVLLNSQFKGVGDFNHDGFDDLAISSPDYSLSSQSNEGRVGLFYGSTNGLHTSYDCSWVGYPGNYFGIGMGSPGDYNSDRAADFLVSAGMQNTNWSGAAYVFNGDGVQRISGLQILHSSPLRLGVSNVFSATVATGEQVVYEWQFVPLTRPVLLSGDSITPTFSLGYTVIVTATNSSNTVTVTDTVTLE